MRPETPLECISAIWDEAVPEYIIAESGKLWDMFITVYYIVYRQGGASGKDHPVTTRRNT
jgi:hypothetical protein